MHRSFLQLILNILFGKRSTVAIHGLTLRRAMEAIRQMYGLLTARSLKRNGTVRQEDLIPGVGRSTMAAALTKFFSKVPMRILTAYSSPATIQESLRRVRISAFPGIRLMEA